SCFSWRRWKRFCSTKGSAYRPEPEWERRFEVIRTQSPPPRRIEGNQSYKGTAPAANRGIPNDGPMSNFVGPFDVVSSLTGQAYQVRFSHLWNGIATRHSDSVDTKFLVDGRAAIVGLAHTG